MKVEVSKESLKLAVALLLAKEYAVHEIETLDKVLTEFAPHVSEVKDEEKPTE